MCFIDDRKAPLNSLSKESLSIEDIEHFIRLHLQERDRLTFQASEMDAHRRGIERILEEIGIPEDLSIDEWLHYVVSPRINNEVLTAWMEEFQTWLWDEVRHLDPVSKILRVNELAAAEVTYRSSNARTLPPPALKRGIYGRCGEESTFVTAALRSVGIPARQVYAPLWNHSDDNHAWVEAYDGKSWRFLGACEPEAVLDIGWFNAAAGRAPLVISRTQFAGNEESPHDLGINRAGQALRNESHRYRAGARVKLSVPSDEEGYLALRLLNYSGLAVLLEVAVRNLNEYEIDLGPGTYHVSYETETKRYANNLDFLSPDDQLVELHEETWDQSWQKMPNVWHAAGVSDLSVEISDEARERGLAIRNQAAEKRQAKEDTQLRYARELAKGRSELVGEILVRSSGNADEVLKLIELTEGKTEVLELLRLIPQKDLYELRADDYFAELQVVLDVAPDLDPILRAETLLNPRVHAEDFSRFRVGLKIERKSPEQILDEMRGKYTLVHQNMETHEPLTVLAMQVELSLRDFTKLLCGQLRAHGYPCRYKGDGSVEVYDPDWRVISVVETSRVKLTSKNKDYAWRAGQNYQLLNIDHAPTPVRSGLGVWSGESDLMHLVGEKFAVITTVRLPNGDQRSELVTAVTTPGEVTEIELSLPHVTGEDLLMDVSLPTAAIAEALDLPAAKRGLAILAQGGDEPTEHAFEELALLWDGLRTRLDHVTIYYDEAREGAPEALKRSPRYSTLEAMGLKAEIKPLNYAVHLETLGRGLFVEPETLPLIMLYETRDSIARIRYSHAGYIVGLGERILNSIEEI